MDQRTVMAVLDRHGMESYVDRQTGQVLVLDVYAHAEPEWVVAPTTVGGLRDWLGY